MRDIELKERVIILCTQTEALVERVDDFIEHQGEVNEQLFSFSRSQGERLASTEKGLEIVEKKTLHGNGINGKGERVVTVRMAGYSSLILAGLGAVAVIIKEMFF